MDQKFWDMTTGYSVVANFRVEPGQVHNSEEAGEVVRKSLQAAQLPLQWDLDIACSNADENEYTDY